MSQADKHVVKIEARQISRPDNFPLSNEWICIRVPKVFDQVALRDYFGETDCGKGSGKKQVHPP